MLQHSLAHTHWDCQYERGWVKAWPPWKMENLRKCHRLKGEQEEVKKTQLPVRQLTIKVFSEQWDSSFTVMRTCSQSSRVDKWEYLPLSVQSKMWSVHSREPDECGTGQRQKKECVCECGKFLLVTRGKGKNSLAPLPSSDRKTAAGKEEGRIQTEQKVEG